MPQYKESYSLSWNDFPPSLTREITAYLDRLAGKDLLAEVDFRPLRPASIESYNRLLRAFLSALVQRGRDPQDLQSLAAVVALDTVREGLRFFIDRAGGTRTKQTYNIARMLTAMARHWVKVDKDHLDQLRAICRRLDCGKGGMTEKNRDRLRQFDDPINVNSFMTLTQRILARQKRRKQVSRADKLEVQSMLAVRLLQLVPIRISNLAGLDLDRNILRNRAAGGRGSSRRPRRAGQERHRYRG